jgi:hypothetical protein
MQKSLVDPVTVVTGIIEPLVGARPVAIPADFRCVSGSGVNQGVSVAVRRTFGHGSGGVAVTGDPLPSIRPGKRFAPLFKQLPNGQATPPESHTLQGARDAGDQ